MEVLGAQNDIIILKTQYFYEKSFLWYKIHTEIRPFYYFFFHDFNEVIYMLKMQEYVKILKYQHKIFLIFLNNFLLF